MSYITTSRLNQDVVEHLFSYLRAMGAANDRPTALDIRYRLRWYILGKHSADIFTEECNTITHDSTDETCLTNDITVYSMEKLPTEDVECGILNVTDFQNELPDNNEVMDNGEVDVDIGTYSLNYIPSLKEEALLHKVDTLDVIDVIEEEGLKYIVGYVAYRFIHKYKDLGTPTQIIVNPEIDWINYISRGRLITPSSHLYEVAKAMNIEFQIFHGNFIRKDP